MYRLMRSGKFNCDLLLEGQCGAPGQKHGFGYEAIVCCEEGKLDDLGFIIDNDDVKRAFTSFEVGQWRGSCEGLAGTALWRLQRAGGDRVCKIEVAIMPWPGSRISVTWEKGQPLPAVRATSVVGCEVGAA